MPILRSLVRERRSSLENPAVPLSSEAILPILAGASTDAGINVSPRTSLTMIAVYAAVRLISEAVGSLPLHVYRRKGPDREQLDDHPASRLLTEQPNVSMDAGVLWRDFVMGHMLLWGNAFLVKLFDERGNVTALWPLPPDRVLLKRRPDGEVGYVANLPPSWIYSSALNLPGKEGMVAFDPDEILHFKAFGHDHWGLSPITLARQEIGTALASSEYQARFFTNDATPGFVLATDTSLTDKQWKRMRAQWNDLHLGAKNAHMTAVLDGGVKPFPTGIPPKDAEFLALRKFSVAEVARLFNIPPHLIGDVDRSTSWGTGIEQQSIGFVTYSLRPWMVRIERTVKLGIFGRPADRDLFAKFSAEGLLRGDIAARYQAYAVGRQWGWLSPNDIRRLEEMPPIEGGDLYLTPANMLPAGTVAQSTPDAIAGRASELVRGELAGVIDAMAAGVRDVGQRYDAYARRQDERLSALEVRPSVIVEAPAPVNVAPAEVHVGSPEVRVEMPAARRTVRTVERDPESKEIVRIIDEEV